MNNFEISFISDIETVDDDNINKPNDLCSIGEEVSQIPIPQNCHVKK